MKVAFALQAQLVPRLAAVAAANQAEWVDQTGPWRRVAAAVDAVRGGGKAHVVVLRTRCLGPLAIFVHRESVVARDHQPLAIGAVREAVYVHKRYRVLGGRYRRQSKQDQSKESHCFLAFRVISARASSTSRVVQWPLMYASAAQISASESLPPKAGMSLS